MGAFLLPKTMGFNLHKVVRSVITTVHPDVKCLLYVSSGHETETDSGLYEMTYFEPVEVKAQFQPSSPESDQFVETIEKQTAARKVYLFASTDLKKRPWALYRPLARTGDFIKDDLNQLWFISGVLEDFSRVGWVLVEVTMETTPRELPIYTETAPEP